MRGLTDDERLALELVGRLEVFDLDIEVMRQLAKDGRIVMEDCNCDCHPVAHIHYKSTPMTKLALELDTIARSGGKVDV